MSQRTFASQVEFKKFGRKSFRPARRLGGNASSFSSVTRSSPTKKEVYERKCGIHALSRRGDPKAYPAGL